MWEHIDTTTHLCYTIGVFMLSKEENIQKIEDKDLKECSVRVRINDKDKQHFYQICQNMGMTPSKVIRKLIEEFCEDNEGKKRLL